MFLVCSCLFITSAFTALPVQALLVATAHKSLRFTLGQVQLWWLVSPTQLDLLEAHHTHLPAVLHGAQGGQ